METLRERAESDDRYFEKLIEKQLINNMHRLSLSVEPSKEHNKRIDDNIAESVAEARRDLSADDRKAEKMKLEAFRKYQDRPDPQELTDKIPSLDIEDVPSEIGR